MEVRDGFISGIFNYCDRWCEACRFTSYCRVFADVARTHASLDPTFKSIMEAPPLPEDVPPPPPRWMQEVFADLNGAASNAPPPEESSATEPRMAAAHEPIQARSLEYMSAVQRWLERHGEVSLASPRDPGSVVAWYHTLIRVKVHRALTGLADGAPDEDPPDHDGSAKVALLAIERSHAAWHDAMAQGLVTPAEVARFTEDLRWLRERLDEVFPRARAFVRPAFDEPGAVARLEAAERF